MTHLETRKINARDGKKIPLIKKMSGGTLVLELHPIYACFMHLAPNYVNSFIRPNN
jgi:hypothetical protein